MTDCDGESRVVRLDAIKRCWRVVVVVLVVVGDDCAGDCDCDCDCDDDEATFTGIAIPVATV